MMRVRGVGRVFAMARPRAPETAKALVAEALRAMPADMSARSKARILAARVVEELVREADAADPFESALRRMRRLTGHDPALQLATHPGLDLIGQFRRARTERFEARGCTWIGKADFDAETREIAATLEIRLAERFRRK